METPQKFLCQIKVAGSQSGIRTTNSPPLHQLSGSELSLKDSLLHGQSTCQLISHPFRSQNWKLVFFQKLETRKIKELTLPWVSPVSGGDRAFLYFWDCPSQLSIGKACQKLVGGVPLKARTQPQADTTILHVKSDKNTLVEKRTSHNQG